jgi:hypothetical protein
MACQRVGGGGGAGAGRIFWVPDICMRFLEPGEPGFFAPGPEGRRFSSVNSSYLMVDGTARLVAGHGRRPVAKENRDAR